MVGEVLVVGRTRDLVQLLRRRLPVLLGHHLNQLLVQVVPADLRLPASNHPYSLLAPSLNISNIFNITEEHQLTAFMPTSPPHSPCFFRKGGSVDGLSLSLPTLRLSFRLGSSCSRYFSTSISRTLTIPLVDFTICLSSWISCSSYLHLRQSESLVSVLRFLPKEAALSLSASACAADNYCYRFLSSCMDLRYRSASVLPYYSECFSRCLS